MQLLQAIGVGLLAGLAGYAVGAFGGMWAIRRFSSNRHDRRVEAAMTGFFVCGPVGAVFGLAGGIVGYLLLAR